MDRQVSVGVHLLLREGNGAIVGYGWEPLSLLPGQSRPGESETDVPNVADVEIYVTSRIGPL